jgi:peptidoglycan/LPS O-acetylase OafA/YrhL
MAPAAGSGIKRTSQFPKGRAMRSRVQQMNQCASLISRERRGACTPNESQANLNLPMSFSTANPGRFAELDGVRGVAIALTLACNTLVVGRGPGYGEKVWNILASGGWIGVQLFFVLSGFLITGILIDTKGDEAYFRNFYARRALRIFPVYYLVLALATVGLWLVGQSTPDHPLCYWLYVSNFCIANAGRWSAHHFGVSWSLAVEEQFYLVWPLLVLFLSTRRFVLATTFTLLGSLLLRYVMAAHDASPLVLYTITPTRLDGLAAGALIAIAVRSNIGAQLLAGIARWMLASGLAAITTTTIAVRSFNYDDLAVATVGYTALTFAAAGLVLLLVAERSADNIVRRSMRQPSLVSVGFYSYAIYLYHPIVYFLVMRLPLFRTEKLAVFPGGELIAQLIVTSTVTIATFALAVASYRLFEKPILELRRYFPRNQAILGPATT